MCHYRSIAVSAWLRYASMPGAISHMRACMWVQWKRVRTRMFGGVRRRGQDAPSYSILEFEKMLVNIPSTVNFPQLEAPLVDIRMVFLFGLSLNDHDGQS